MLNNTLNLKADQCVKCGLCLPHCPTYRIFENENESPRGRIALIQGLLKQQIQPSEKLTQHLDHCLACRACERVCPSAVDYGFLLDHARQQLHQHKPDKRFKQTLSRWGLALATHKSWQRRLQGLLYFYRLSGLQALLRISGLLRLLRIHNWEKALPRLESYQALKPVYRSTTGNRGRLGIFTGCTGNLFDQQTLQDTVYLLQRLGYDIVVPPQQTCCGALHQHQGIQTEASRLALQNIEAFKGLDTIIYIASGCGAQLKDYPVFSWQDTDQSTSAGAFSSRLNEICDFLSKEDLSQFKFRAMHKTLMVHTPCSMQNVLRQKDGSTALLRHIPDVTITQLPADTGCCGAAGSYMLNFPGLARQIRKTSIEAITRRHPQLVTTTNIGCRLHLAAGLPKGIHMSHPVSLLVQQIEY